VGERTEEKFVGDDKDGAAALALGYAVEVDSA
jgi:hypothetical protein